MNSYEILSGKWFVEFGKEECCLDNVEREDRVDAMCHVKEGETNVSLYSNPISPKYDWGNFWPMSDVALTCLDNQISYRPVASFNQAICLFIISEYADMINVILL